MTTVAYRDGIMAADSGVNRDGTRVHCARKVWRLRSGALLGAAGITAECLAFRKWLISGAHEEDFPRLHEMDALLVYPDGRVASFEYHRPEPIPAKGAYFAIGSGADFALGALAAGADADDAVRAARKHDACTFGRIFTVRLAT